MVISGGLFPGTGVFVGVTVGVLLGNGVTVDVGVAVGIGVFVDVGVAGGTGVGVGMFNSDVTLTIAIIKFLVSTFPSTSSVTLTITGDD